MVLRRDGYEAAFYWERYWESEVPKEIVLKKFTDPDGKMVHCLDAVAYAEALKTHFPDAFERFFKSLEASREPNKKGLTLSEPLEKAELLEKAEPYARDCGKADDRNLKCSLGNHRD